MSAAARRVTFALLLLLVATALYVLRTAGDRVIFAGTGEFGEVRVVERADGVRALRTGERRTLQTALIPGRPRELLLDYTRVAVIALALVADTARVLYVGLGGGAMPMHARDVLPRATIDVVEIDPLIVDVAHRYFGFESDARTRTHTADGRALIESAPPASWDLIVLDAFSGDEIPRSLATLEFLESVRSRLSPGGLVATNLWTSATEYDAMLATYLAAFADVIAVRVGRRAQNILLARDDAAVMTRDELVRDAAAFEARTGLGFDLAALVQRGYHRPAAPQAALLRDER